MGEQQKEWDIKCKVSGDNTTILHIKAGGCEYICIDHDGYCRIFHHKWCQACLWPDNTRRKKREELEKGQDEV